MAQEIAGLADDGENRRALAGILFGCADAKALDKVHALAVLVFRANKLGPKITEARDALVKVEQEAKNSAHFF